MSDQLTIHWINEQRARANMAAMVDVHTFRIVLDNLESTMQREQRLREALHQLKPNDSWIPEHKGGCPLCGFTPDRIVEYIDKALADNPNE